MCVLGSLACPPGQLTQLAEESELKTMERKSCNFGKCNLAGERVKGSFSRFLF